MVNRFGTRLVKKGNILVPATRQNSHGGYRYSRESWADPENHNSLHIINSEKYSNLRLFIRKEPKEGEYKYLVSNNYGQGTDAFYTEQGLNRFLKRTGLKKVFQEEMSHGFSYLLSGSFERIYMSGNYKLFNRFGQKNNLTRTKIMDNGDYTTGYYDGNGKIFLLNPNYPRTIYNHFWE